MGDRAAHSKVAVGEVARSNPFIHCTRFRWKEGLHEVELEGWPIPDPIPFERIFSFSQKRGLGRLARVGGKSGRTFLYICNTNVSLSLRTK